MKQIWLSLEAAWVKPWAGRVSRRRRKGDDGWLERAASEKKREELERESSHGGERPGRKIERREWKGATAALPRGWQLQPSKWEKEIRVSWDFRVF